MKKILKLFILLLIIGCGSSNPHQEKLKAPDGNKIYFGAFPDFGGSEDNVTTEALDNFKHLIGKEPIWAYFSQNWFNGIRYPKEAIDTIHKRGMIPFVRIMPRSNEQQYAKETKFTMSNIIKGMFDKELRAWAKDAKVAKIPLLIDFAVEANGDWFSWSGIFNGKDTTDKYGDKNYFDGAERYRDAYRHIIDIFRKERVNNITWFFHADIYSAPNKEWNKAKYYYPGDDYIDWIGVSLYGAQNSKEDYWDSFSQILEERYKSILEISTAKPIALLEFGVTDNNPNGNKSVWLEDAFETILSGQYINFKAISYWHENWKEENGAIASIRIDSSPESLAIFKKHIQNRRFLGLR